MPSRTEPAQERASERAGIGRTAEKVAYWLLVGCVALAPLPFGSTDPVAVCVEVIVLGLAVIFSRRDPRQPIDPWLLVFLVALAVAYLLVFAVQLDWLGISKQYPDPVWDRAGQLLDQSLAAIPAIAWGQQYWALLNPLAALLAITSSYLLCWDRDRAHRLLLVAGGACVTYAVIGIVFYLLLPDYVLWRKKTAHVGYLTATFLNRNTAAVYFAGGGLIWLLIAMRRLSAYLPDGDRSAVFRTILHSLPRRVLYPTIALAICIQAMLFTGSRAGIMLGLFVCAASLLVLKWRKVRGKLLAFVLGGGLIAVLLVQTLGVDRFQQYGLSDYSRLATYRTTIAMIIDRPFFGWGLGAFAWAYPPNRSADVSIIGVWDRAHNSWLELASEGGLVLAAIVGAGWLYILYRLMRGVLDRHRDRHIPLAALGFVTLGLCHSLIDFSLQIPGFLIVLGAIAGAGLAQSVRRRRRSSARSDGVS